MGAVKDGVKTTLRMPGKTALFSAVLLLLALLVSVAFSVFAAVREYLKDCESNFHTVVDLEYLGSDYPSRNPISPRAATPSIRCSERCTMNRCGCRAHPSP